eukprot:m.329935 g.329935  ORF g.329935 m.329935 type:complete len:291 (+) comp27715_c0_seq12:428-1300(+)
MFTQKQKEILMTITQSGDRRFSIQAPPGSGKTLLWLHLAILFVHGRLKLETRSTKRFLMLTHDPALANTFASIVAAETEQVLEVAPVRIDPPPVPGAVVLVWDDARGHSTEVHVCSVDAFVQWQTGIQHPYVRQECPPRLQSAPLYCSVAVNEGHRVFSYQPHAHITGQHNLRTIDHVRQILHHASDPGCQLVFFHDKDYQSIGSPIADSGSPSGAAAPHSSSRPPKALHSRLNSWSGTAPPSRWPTSVFRYLAIESMRLDSRWFGAAAARTALTSFCRSRAAMQEMSHF